jgi:predicted dehydrogenase
MATTLEDCEAMVAAAKESGKFLMLGHNQRLVETHVKAKEMLDSGLIGDIVSFRTTFGHGGTETWSIDPGKDVWFFNKSKAAMGAMADLGIHKTDLIHFLTGQLVVETTARLSTIDKRYANGELIEVDDNAICIYKLSNSAVGTMTASWTFYGSEDNSTILYGTKGIMRIFDDPAYSIKVITHTGEEKLYQVDQIQTNDNQTKSGVIDAFMDCLVENKQPEISGEVALKTMRVIFASIESSRKNQTVKVDQP